LGRLGEPERRTLSGPLQRAAAEINRAIGGRG
jgi:hypothetical protein